MTCRSARTVCGLPARRADRLCQTVPFISAYPRRPRGALASPRARAPLAYVQLPKGDKVQTVGRACSPERKPRARMGGNMPPTNRLSAPCAWLKGVPRRALPALTKFSFCAIGACCGNCGRAVAPWGQICRQSRACPRFISRRAHTRQPRKNGNFV